MYYHGVPIFDLKGTVMKNVPDWLQAAVIVTVFLSSIAGLYASHRVQMAQFDERLKQVERIQDKNNQRTMQVLDRLSGSIEKLSVNIARLEARQDAVENDR